MPQMAPLNWLILYLYFLMFFLSLMLLIFIHLIMTLNFQKNKIFINL